MSHDQNFKNLILDYPREAIGFFAAVEARAIDAGARLLPLREEQLKARLGERFRELDVPLLVEWPDGRRAALLFVFEEESDPVRFSIHRLAHYCLDLAELYATERVVPVVIFLHAGSYATRLTLGSETQTYLDFSFLACALSRIPARDHLSSTNLVARLNLPNMAYDPADKLLVYAQAVRGLIELEPHPERRLKYVDFIDIYADLDENERQRYADLYPDEARTMTGFAQRFIEEGRQEGRQEGRLEGRQEGRLEGRQEGRQEGLQHGEARVLTALLRLRFGELPTAAQHRIEQADAETLLRWSERVLTAQSLSEVLDRDPAV